MIYADYNATTPLGSGAKSAIEEAFEIWGNPSSTHAVGRSANDLLEKHRESVAKRAEVRPNELVFTSGGSEANGNAILGAFLACQNRPFKMLTSPVEHSSVNGMRDLIALQGAEVEKVTLEPSGTIDLTAFEKQLDSFQPHLVSLMTANNETGILFPIREIAKLCHEREILVHADCIQAFGKLSPDYWNDADLITLSAHKIYGPKGVGALVVKGGKKLIRTHFGGSQEVKRRGGTENMLGICGFGGACETMMSADEVNKIEVLRDKFERLLKESVDGVSISGANIPRIPNTSSLRFKGVRADVLLTALDLEGICISAGSACASGSIDPSHVLLGIGLTPEEALEGLRVSWGRSTTEQQVETVAQRLIHHVTRIRNRKR